MYKERIYELIQQAEYKKACKEFQDKWLTAAGSCCIIKWNEGEHPRSEDGRFTSSGSKSSKRNSKTKYALSAQRQRKGIQVSPKKYAKLTGIMNTRYPGLKPEDGKKTIRDANNSYKISADGYGGMIIHSRTKIE